MGLYRKRRIVFHICSPETPNHCRGERVMFGGSCHLTIDPHRVAIRSHETPNNLLAIVVQVLRHPLTFMQIESLCTLGTMGKHNVRTRCSSLTNPVITLFLIKNPHNSIHLPLFLYPPPIFCSSATRVGSFIRGAGADFELVDLVAP